MQRVQARAQFDGVGVQSGSQARIWRTDLPGCISGKGLD